MPNLKKKTIVTLVILVIALTGGGLAIRQMQQAAKVKSAAVLETAAVRRMDLSETIDATGEVTTEKNASIYSPYSATVKEILVKPGASVHKGDVLLVLQLKDTDLINYSSTWRSALDQARLKLNIAQQALKRQEILYKVQGTTIDDLESAQSLVKQYQEEVKDYELKLATLAKNGVDHRNNILIKAPFDADISWIDVKLEEAVTTSSELLTFGGNSVIRVQAAVDQGDIDQIRIGLSAQITANDQNRTLIPGVVASFGGTGTTSSNVVTFPVVIKPTSGKSPTQPSRSPNPPGAGNPPPDRATAPQSQAMLRLLKTGMSVDVTITVSDHANVLAVPLQAVKLRDGAATVQVVTEGKLVARQVKLGYRNTDYAEVLSGLRQGEQVAVVKTADGAAATAATKTKTNRGTVGGGPMGGPPPM